MDRENPEYKAPWNQISNIPRVYTADDKAMQIVASYPQADVSTNEVSTLAQIYIALHCWQRHCHTLNLPFP